MKWIAIAGSWKESAPGLEPEVRAAVREAALRGDGIVTGGALGVDYLAADECLKADPTASKIRIFLPCSLERYAEHYRARAREGAIVASQAEALIGQLERIASLRPEAVVGDPSVSTVDRAAYFERITEIVAAADSLIAFQVNRSEGTQDTIDKARKKGIPVKINAYVSN